MRWTLDERAAKRSWAWRSYHRKCRIAAALLRSAIRPMLITRAQYQPIQDVVLGWDGGPEAAHAAEMVFGLAKGGRWQVHVVSAGHTTSALAQSCSYIAEQMKREGVKADSHVVSGDVPQVIFDVVNHFVADVVGHLL